MSKGVSFKQAKELRDALAKGTIIRPDVAVESEVAQYHEQISNLWTTRDKVLFAALSGGHPVTVETLNDADAVARDIIRRRCEEALEVNAITDKKPTEAFLFLSSLVGVDVSEWLKEKPEPSTNKLVSAH